MRGEVSDFRRIGDILPEVLASAPALTGVGAGFPFLPPERGGLHPGELITIAGASSSGKTALALGLADHIAAGREARPVGLFALADEVQQLALRLLANHSGVKSTALRSGVRQWKQTKVLRSLEHLKTAPLAVFRGIDFSILSILDQARAARRHGGFDLLIVDYLQLLEDPETAYDNRQDILSGLVRRLKYVAKELEVPVVVVADLECDTSRRPSLADLGSCDVLAEHSDLVLLIHRPELWNLGNSLEPAEVLVAKDRRGPACTFTTEWVREFATFLELIAA